MSIAERGVFGIAVLLAGLSGTMINSFLLTLYLLQWKNSRNSVCDQIQMSIAVTNDFLQVCLSFDGMLDTLGMFFRLSKNALLAMLTLQYSFFYASVWNTAWLSMFYFVQLVNFSHPYLLRMKAVFLSSVPQLIVGSSLGSIIITLPLFWVTEVNPIQNVTLLTVASAYDFNINFSFSMCNSFFGCILPITVTCLCIGQCVTSLLRHVWRINLSESHLTSSQLQGHIRATRIMIMRLVLDLIFSLLDDVLFVEQQPETFTTDSAQRLIGQIMAWNGEIDAMRNCLNIMQQEMKKMIDILGRM
ncbi:taste receptor type 2 member 41-like [Lithobates pipiens]